MKKLVLTLLALSACSGGNESNRAAEGNGAGAESSPPAATRPGAPAALATLVGLYEGGDAARPHRMCVVEREGGTSFGLVVWGGNDHSCSGAGTVTREGSTLRLAMAGDSACTLTATVSGKTVTLPEANPAGCSYYCGARATLAGVSLTQTGTTEAAAAEAKDLVGESLCAGA